MVNKKRANNILQNIGLLTQTSRCHQVLCHAFKTMEAYTLWWNGDMLWKMLDYNTKYSPFMDNWMLLWEGGPNMEGWKWIVTFRWNDVKMAWAFMNIMDVIHHSGILHNDLSKETSSCIFHPTTQVLCTLACVICVKLNNCKRWFHLCMDFLQNCKIH